MRTITYIRGQLEWFVSMTTIFVLVNLILLTSTPLDKSFGEIIYLDLLLLVVLGSGFIIHFIRMNKVYKNILQTISEGKDIDYLFDNESDVLGTSIMKQLLEYKNQNFLKKENDYQQRMNDLKDYITQTVHDLKVNLSVCEMATNRLENEDTIVNKLLFQIEQMKFRINQALYITRANHYSEDIVSENVDIGQIVKESIDDNREFFLNKGISIHIASLKPYQLVSDKKWVYYIISQILNNSSKYTEKNGEVEISSNEDDQGYYLHFKDNGIGIPEEELGRVFDKGFTGSNGRSNTKSTGMGMYYAKKMSNTLGIGMELQSERGVYTEFILSFYKLSDYMLLQRS
ncbi:MAG: ATP-binding protein [Ruminiclostridium sp.]